MGRKFKENDLVWAKMKGHPHWPARVCKPPSAQKSPTSKYYVFFYGTLQYGWISEVNLFPYEEFKDKFTKPCQRKKFNEAIWQIQEDPFLKISSTVKTPKGRIKKTEASKEKPKSLKASDEKKPSVSPVATRGSKRHMTEPTGETPDSKRGFHHHTPGDKLENLEITADSLMLEDPFGKPSDSPAPSTDEPVASRRQTRGMDRAAKGLEEVGEGYVQKLTKDYATRKEQAILSPTEREQGSDRGKKSQSISSTPVAPSPASTRKSATSKRASTSKAAPESKRTPVAQPKKTLVARSEGAKRRSKVHGVLPASAYISSRTRSGVRQQRSATPSTPVSVASDSSEVKEEVQSPKAEMSKDQAHEKEDDSTSVAKDPGTPNTPNLTHAEVTATEGGTSAAISTDLDAEEQSDEKSCPEAASGELKSTIDRQVVTDAVQSGVDQEVSRTAELKDHASQDSEPSAVSDEAPPTVSGHDDDGSNVAVSASFAAESANLPDNLAPKLPPPKPVEEDVTCVPENIAPPAPGGVAKPPMTKAGAIELSQHIRPPPLPPSSFEANQNSPGLSGGSGRLATPSLLLPLQLSELSGSDVVEAALSATDHAMFELDSDIISLLNEVPDDMIWDSPIATTTPGPGSQAEGLGASFHADVFQQAVTGQDGGLGQGDLVGQSVECPIGQGVSLGEPVESGTGQKGANECEKGVEQKVGEVFQAESVESGGNQGVGDKGAELPSAEGDQEVEDKGACSSSFMPDDQGDQEVGDKGTEQVGDSNVVSEVKGVHGVEDKGVPLEVESGMTEGEEGSAKVEDKGVPQEMEVEGGGTTEVEDKGVSQMMEVEGRGTAEDEVGKAEVEDKSTTQETEVVGTAEVEDKGTTPEMETTEVEDKGTTPEMETTEVEDKGTTPEMETTEVEDKGATPEMETTEVEDKGTTPEMETTEVEDKGATPEMETTEVEDKGTTPEMETAEVGDKGTETAEVGDKGTTPEMETAEVGDKGTETAEVGDKGTTPEMETTEVEDKDTATAEQGEEEKMEQENVLAKDLSEVDKEAESIESETDEMDSDEQQGEKVKVQTSPEREPCDLLKVKIEKAADEAEAEIVSRTGLRSNTTGPRRSSSRLATCHAPLTPQAPPTIITAAATSTPAPKKKPTKSKPEPPSSQERRSLRVRTRKMSSPDLREISPSKRPHIDEGSSGVDEAGKKSRASKKEEPGVEAKKREEATKESKESKRPTRNKSRTAAKECATPTRDSDVTVAESSKKSKSEAKKLADAKKSDSSDDASRVSRQAGGKKSRSSASSEVKPSCSDRKLPKAEQIKDEPPTADDKPLTADQTKDKTPTPDQSKDEGTSKDLRSSKRRRLDSKDDAPSKSTRKAKRLKDAVKSEEELSSEDGASRKEKPTSEKTPVPAGKRKLRQTKLTESIGKSAKGSDSEKEASKADSSNKRDTSKTEKIPEAAPTSKSTKKASKSDSVSSFDNKAAPTSSAAGRKKLKSDPVVTKRSKSKTVVSEDESSNTVDGKDSKIAPSPEPKELPQKVEKDIDTKSKQPTPPPTQDFDDLEIVAMETSEAGGEGEACKENGEPNASQCEVSSSEQTPPILRVQTGMSNKEVLQICNYNLKASLVVDGANIQQAMITLRDLQELACSTTDLNEVPDLIYTLRKVRRYRPNPKIMKKAEDVYTRFRAMYLRPHVTLPPATRRTKTTPTMADYISKQSTKAASPSKLQTRQSAAPDAPSGTKLANSASAATRDTPPKDMTFDPESSKDGITDVISHKPSAQTIKDLNTPLVPNVDEEKPKSARSKVTSTVRMKNVTSPSSSRSLRASTRTTRSSSQATGGVAGNQGGGVAGTSNSGQSAEQDTNDDQIVPS